MNSIVIGAGIVGLATARALAVRGHSVTVLERSPRALGASIRNFGMIWPIGQPDGDLYDRASRSKSVWKEICCATGLWNDEAGSLHLAYNDDEWRVLQELRDIYRQRSYELLSADQTLRLSPAVAAAGLKGSLFSTDEMIVDPREAIQTISSWLAEKYDMRFLYGKSVTAIAQPKVFCGDEAFDADMIWVCSGADLETLYPHVFLSLPLTKCKLQMMRFAPPKKNWRIGPALCGALSLAHYKSFSVAPSLDALKRRFEMEFPEYMRLGIHVMVAQNGSGELTVGDSHEYGMSPDPFDRHYVNRLITDYLATFAAFRHNQITETWNGVYAKLTDGSSEIVMSPEPGVTIINGLGGAGMTLSFGLCEEVVSRLPA